MSAVNEQEAPRSGAVWEFLAFTVIGGALVAAILLLLGLGAISWMLWLLWPGLIALIVARRRAISLNDWGLRVVDRRSLYAVGLAAALAGVILVSRFALAPERLSETIAEVGWSLLFAPFAFLMWLMVGLLREIPLRGLLLTELGGRGLSRGILLTAIPGFLSVGHLPLPADSGVAAVMLTRLAGVGLHVIAGWLRVYAGSIYAGAAFYAAWMSLAVLPSDTMPSGVVVIATAAVLITAIFLLRFRLPEKSTASISIRKCGETKQQ